MFSIMISILHFTKEDLCITVNKLILRYYKEKKDFHRPLTYVHIYMMFYHSLTKETHKNLRHYYRFGVFYAATDFPKVIDTKAGFEGNMTIFQMSRETYIIME